MTARAPRGPAAASPDASEPTASGLGRRSLLKYAAGTAAAAALAPLAAGCGRGGDDPPAGGRSNVLVILADDMRYDFLPHMANVQELLVGPGRSFSQARCNVGLCQPCRVSLLTGQWSIHNGVVGQGPTSLEVLDQDDTVGAWMHDAGYRTALIGKYLNTQGPMTPQPKGWDVWRQLVDDADTTYFERGFRVHDGATTTSPSGTATDYLEAEALRFIQDGPEPWFLLLTPTSPHYPFEAPDAELEQWAELDWPIVLEADVADKPSWIRSAPELTPAEVAVMQETARAQLGELTTLDRSIANILEGMGADVLANTVVIFSSDNGLNYGEHRNRYVGIAKIELYEPSLHVPCVIRGPGITPGPSSAPVSVAADLTATVCAVAGARPTRPPDGVDLRRPIDPERLLLASRGGGGRQSLNPHPGHCVITPTQKLMRWDVEGEDRYEAYDHQADPDEHVNWANDPARRAERDALEARLDELLRS